MRSLLRRRVIVPAAVAIVGAAVVTGAAWFLLSGERRMGLVAERWLVGHTGLPMAVGGASWNGRRVLLRSFHLAPSPGLPLDILVPALSVRGVLGLLRGQAGHGVSVTAASATITLPDPVTTEAGVEAVRRQILAILGWSGQLDIRLEGAELRSEPAGRPAVVEGRKHGPSMTIALTLPASRGGDDLRVTLRGAAALGRSLDLAVDLAGSPAEAAVLWPVLASLTAPITGRIQVQLFSGAVLVAFGRVSHPSSRTSLDFTSRYGAAGRELAISRYSLALGEDLRIAGSARLAPAAEAGRLSATAAGEAAGTRVSAAGSYDVGSGAFEADVRLDGPGAGGIARRLGVAEAPPEARAVHSRITGGGGTVTSHVLVGARGESAASAR